MVLLYCFNKVKSEPETFSFTIRQIMESIEKELGYFLKYEFPLS